MYLSYSEVRTVRVRIGSVRRASMRLLASEYFSSDGAAIPAMVAELDSFVMRAKEIDPSFRCYPDALDFISEAKDALYRRDYLSRLTDKDLDGLLNMLTLPPPTSLRPPLNIPTPVESPTDEATPSPESLITQGVSFLSGLADTLRTEEGIRKLTDTLVKTDPQSGKSEIHIPVPDKETVSGILTLFSRLLKG